MRERREIYISLKIRFAINVWNFCWRKNFQASSEATSRMEAQMQKCCITTLQPDWNEVMSYENNHNYSLEQALLSF